MSAVDTPHLILFEFFIKIQALLQEPFVFRLVCTFFVSARACTCVFAQTLFSMKCNKLCVPFTCLCTHSYVNYCYCFLTLFLLSLLANAGGPRWSGTGFHTPDWTFSCRQPRTPLSPTIFCAGDPDAALNAGHRRLLTKLGERGVLCVRA